MGHTRHCKYSFRSQGAAACGDFFKFPCRCAHSSRNYRLKGADQRSSADAANPKRKALAITTMRKLETRNSRVAPSLLAFSVRLSREEPTSSKSLPRNKRIKESRERIRE
jgi:hypothetical protein